MKTRVTLILAAVLATLLPTTLNAQDAATEAARRVATLRAVPAEITVGLGERVPFRIEAVDAEGNVVEGAHFRIFGRGVDIEDGYLTGTVGGSTTVMASLVVPTDFDGTPPQVSAPVEVTWPAVARVAIEARSTDRLYEGTSIRHRAAAMHADGSPRPEAEFSWSSSDESIASVDAFGTVTAHRPGQVTIRADIENARGTVEYAVPAFPANSLEIRGGQERAVQGEVVTFEAVASGAAGAVADLPVTWSVFFVPDDTIHAPGASGLVDDGKFVGETPGQYTVLASAGDLVARTSVDVRPRNVVREVEVQGQGSVDHVHTSDLWVFEGTDGRDYAVTGTWGGDGWAYFWDVTDPANIVRYDSIQVDARTVNDVKVSPDGRYAALSREGASNRANGPVLIDLSDPRNPEIATYIEDPRITGGVHNMFATETHLFALAGGDKYVIFDVNDLQNPTFVSEYNHPDSRIHDVWVYDGIAYSSEWGNGVVVVDVGNGRWGGTIENPVFVNNVPYPVGATHAAFPYYQESTGKVYLFLGDEIMARGGAAWSGAGLNRIPQQGGTPSVTSGYIHIIDFTDPENPRDVARYEVPEFGTHNLWVEEDVMYVAYYEGGLRAVDVAGELMGNLANQGREIAVYKAFDPQGFVANAPMAWGPQPYKGYVFFSDFNSGLWSVRIRPRDRPTT